VNIDKPLTKAADPTPSPPPPSPPFDLSALSIKISCTQAKGVASGVAGTQVACLALDAQGNPPQLDANAVESRWIYQAPTGVTVTAPTVSGSGTNVVAANSGQFEFADPASLGLFFALEQGGYALQVTDKKDPNKVKLFKADSAAIVGEGCGAANTVSFTFDLSKYNKAQSAIVLGTTGSFAVDKGVNFRVSASNLNFFVMPGGVADNFGTGSTGATAIVLDGGKFTAEALPNSVIGGLGSDITANVTKVKIFKRALVYCPPAPS
jgi:hypothetical protein